MVKMSSLTWPTCPHCGTELNDPGLIPLSVVMYGSCPPMNCPMKECGKKIHILAKVTVEFIALDAQKQKKDSENGK